ncbi:MAG TPA: FAD-dependent monooxygenase [Trebonia sp.]|nr:FAD-dependent monooxygenase [Trebonia sp.]
MTGSSTPIRAVVAGGSLVGLSAAIALSRLGIDVTVFERTAARAEDGGGGLGVDTDLLREVTGLSAAPPVVHGIDRDTGAWHLLQAWLEDQARSRPGARIGRGTAVVSVLPGDAGRSAIVTTSDGARHHADLVIGADGARSTVRAAVAPGQPDAGYAGVLLWRTLVAERDLPPGTPLPRAGEPSREIYAGPYRLVTYLVPGPHGQTTVGGRRLNLVWYDPEQRDLLQDRGLLDGDLVRGTLAPGALPGPVRDRLTAFASAVWPSPWREALTVAFAAGTVFGTPIVQYRPQSLAYGRVALAGDAAHAASPMVGGGFRQGLYDVRALAQALDGLAGPADVPAALAGYNADRLGPAVAHVRASERATAIYLARATQTAREVS